jgi:hypothetical protein
MKIDGTGDTKLCDDTPWDINIIGDWIYYFMDKGDDMIRIRTDGTHREIF